MLIGALRRLTRSPAAPRRAGEPRTEVDGSLARRLARSRGPQLLERTARRVDGEHGRAARRDGDDADRARADDDALEQVEVGAEGVRDGGLDGVGVGDAHDGATRM